MTPGSAESTPEARGSRVSRAAVSALVVATPTLVTCALLAVLFHATLLNYFPLVSDELAYYQQIATFVRAGFGGGYFTYDEVPAPMAATHFGVHGPAFPVMYGLIGRLAGWTIQSGPILNLVVLAIATTLFIWMTRPSLRQIVMLGGVMLTSWWVTLMASITMQESLNQAFMVVAAAFAVCLLRDDTRRRGLLLLVVLTTLAAASVLRPTNWIVAIALVFVGFPRRPWSAAWGALAAGVGLAVFWLLWRFISAPIPGLPIDLAGATGAGAVTRVGTYFVSQVSMNVAAIFDVRSFVERPFFQHVVYESTAVAAVSGLLVALAFGKAVAGRQGSRRPIEFMGTLPFRVDVLNLIVLGIALVALFGFYFDSEASISRVLAPFLLWSQLVLVATRCRTWLLASTVVANLLVAPSFVTTYREWRGDLFTYDRARFELFRRQVSSSIVFHPDDNAWCNTLLTMSSDREIVGVPAGIGLSVAKNPASNVPIKSRYLLLTGDGPQRYRSRTTLQYLGATVLGDLYLNRDARCG